MIWILPLLGCGAAAYLLLDCMLGSKTSIQQGAEAAMACACVVIPYVFACAVQELRTKLPERKESAANPVMLRDWLRWGSYLAGVVVAILIVGYTVSYVVNLPDGPSGPEAEKACQEFRPVYEKLAAPDTDQLKMARNCRDRGYWR